MASSEPFRISILTGILCKNVHNYFQEASMFHVKWDILFKVSRGVNVLASSSTTCPKLRSTGLISRLAFIKTRDQSQPHFKRPFLSLPIYLRPIEKKFCFPLSSHATYRNLCHLSSLVGPCATKQASHTSIFLLHMSTNSSLNLSVSFKSVERTRGEDNDVVNVSLGKAGFSRQ